MGKTLKIFIAIIFCVICISIKVKSQSLSIEIDSNANLTINKHLVCEDCIFNYALIDSMFQNVPTKSIKQKRIKHSDNITVKYPHIGIEFQGTQYWTTTSFPTLVYNPSKENVTFNLLGKIISGKTDFHEIYNNEQIKSHIDTVTQIGKIRITEHLIQLKIKNSFCSIVFYTNNEKYGLVKNVVFSAPRKNR